MADVQNREQSNEEEYLSEDARKLLKEFETSVMNEDSMRKNFRVWLAITKDNTYY